MSAFISSPVQPTVTEDDSPDRFEELVMLGARISEGFELSRLHELDSRRAAQLETRAEPLIKAGLMTVANGRAALTEKAYLISNAVIARLI